MLKNIFFRDTGVGKPIVILHGLYSSSDAWLPVAKMLNTAGYRTIIPDIRNHGKSFHTDSHTYPEIASDLFTLIQHLGISGFFLVGHSMGGKAAMQFLHDYPGNTYASVIADIAPRRYESFVYGGISHHEVLEFMIDTDLSKLKNYTDFQALIPKHFNLDAHFFIKNLKRNPDKTFSWKINVRTLLRSLDSIRSQVPFVPDCPALFLRGAMSGYISQSDKQQLIAVPNTRIIDLENVGHRLHSEKPAETARELIKFFNAV